ncbi:DoxX family membrane protein [Streptomyces inhibens]|uniref:DoxX family membrane protein n=1 Tax=Streptomyces inhibens TaxID=2293571 RepID=UPI001EE73612|nr:DoxX family membrane protein [Streptomyces inhibens]UKY53475.1 DoxX family membrane protein [Streptomyces inhibens]
MVQLPEARDVAPRLATGAFLLNSGLTKLRADQATAQAVHGMACTAYPFLEKLPAERFTRLLACSEIAVGSALLAPLVPTRLAGLALTGFSSGLVGLYLRLPGMRKPGSLLPTQEGIVLAKDSWMLGIGLGFLSAPCRRRRAAARRSSRHGRRHGCCRR